MQAVHLHFVSRGRANVALLVPVGGEGLSAQDHVDKHRPCANQTKQKEALLCCMDREILPFELWLLNTILCGTGATINNNLVSISFYCSGFKIFQFLDLKMRKYIKLGHCCSKELYFKNIFLSTCKSFSKIYSVAGIV